MGAMGFQIFAKCENGNFQDAKGRGQLTKKRPKIGALERQSADRQAIHTEKRCNFYNVLSASGNSPKNAQAPNTGSLRTGYL